MIKGHYGFPVVWHSNWQLLTPAQKGTWTRRFIRRAHRARARAIGSVLLGWIRYLRHRQRMRDLATLSAMDDLMLRDIGISRCEIRGALESGAELMPAADVRSNIS